MHLQCTVIFVTDIPQNFQSGNVLNNESVRYTLSDHIAFLGPKKCSSLLKGKEEEPYIYFFRVYLLRAGLLYPNTKHDHELSFHNSYVQLTTLFSARHESPLSQRLSSTLSTSLGSRPFSGAKELVASPQA